MLPVIAITGPTASGKTALAIALAQRLDTEILSVDSMQFYRGMEIGTAAPTPAERAQVPHHFVAFLDPREEMAAGRFEHLARTEIARINASGRPALLAGGSGLYLNAVIDGLFPGPARQPRIRARLKAEAAEKGNAWMMARLREVDPDYAGALTSENDLVRIVRALEVYELTGAPFSQLHRDHRAQAETLDARIFALDWDRETLYARIDRRVDQMIADGWIDEVQALIDAGLGPQIDRLKALGYREITAYLRNEQSLDEAIAATKQHHRRYAKRQLTWFRADSRIQWLEMNEGADPGAFANTIIEELKLKSISKDQ
jgi:tRNA dimethylallyltransferase